MLLEIAFPRASRYDVAWARANSLGENVLYLAETLTNALPLRPGMRVLDMGCGHAISSIFLAREFGVTVWAVDRGIDPTANFGRIAALGCEERVFPIRVDVRDLPFPQDYFDAAIALDSYTYFGTDERFLPFLARHVKLGGSIGVVDACFSRELDRADLVAPEHRAVWQTDWWSMHTIDWWRRHWEKTGLVEVKVAEQIPESELVKQDYITTFGESPEDAAFAAFLNAEGGTLVGTFRLVGQRTDRSPFLEEDETDVPY